jgi:hypothetical protein
MFAAEITLIFTGTKNPRHFFPANQTNAHPELSLFLACP